MSDEKKSAMTVRYFVTGRGSFPADMLRYDYTRIVKPANVGGFDGFILEGDREPTYDRWRSFLWTVMPMRFEQVSGNWLVKFAGRWEAFVL